MEIVSLKGADSKTVAQKIQDALLRKGYSSYATPKTSTGINLSDIRLSNEYVKKYGRNINSSSGRRGNVLGWHNWVEVNNTINDVLDKLHAKARVKSLKGKFLVREGNKRYNESDWENIAYENVGSVVEPIPRKDAWLPEFPEKVQRNSRR